MHPLKKVAVTGVNAALACAMLPFRPFEKRSDDFGPVGIRRILLVDCGLFGDTIISFPAVRSIRDRFPDAHLAAVINPQMRQLWESAGDCDQLIPYVAPWMIYGHGYRVADYFAWRQVIREMRKSPIDLTVEFSGDLRSLLFIVRASRAPRRVSVDLTGGRSLVTRLLPYPGRPEVENNLAIAMAIGGDDKPNTFAVDEQRRTRIGDILGDRDADRPRVYFAVTPGYDSKRWPEERWVELGRALHAEHTIIFAGAPGDDLAGRLASHIPGAIDLTGQLDLLDLAALLAEVDLAVGVDTGPMHLATAVNTPAVCLMGPTDPVRWGPLGAALVISDTGAMDGIGVDRVLATVMHLIHEAAHTSPEPASL